jgi:hypothetical protein
MSAHGSPRAIIQKDGNTAQYFRPEIKITVMKTFMCILLSFSLLSIKAQAGTDSSSTQSSNKKRCENYWVLETGKTGNNNYRLIRFYDSNNNLLMEKKVDDVALKGERGSVQRKLNRALKAYIAQPSTANEYLVAFEPKKSTIH